MARSKSSTCAYPDMPESKSISVRKIENGYVVSESSSGPKGYHSSERFSAEKPSLEPKAAASRAKPKANPMSGALRKAMKHALG